MVSGTCDGGRSALTAKVSLDNLALALSMPSKLKTPVPAHQVVTFMEALAMDISKKNAELVAELEKTVRRAHDIKADNPKV